MSDSIEVKWTETKTEERSATVQWCGSYVAVGIGNGAMYGFAHERDLPDSWKTEKSELYEKVRHFIWQHREFEETDEECEFLDSTGELWTIEKAGDGFLITYSSGATVDYSMEQLRSLAKRYTNHRSWPRALAFAEKHSAPELRDAQYQFPGFPVQEMRVSGCLLVLDDDDDILTRAELVNAMADCEDIDRPTWQRLLDYYDREMMETRFWRNEQGDVFAWVATSAAGRVSIESTRFWSTDTAREVADHIKALCEVLEAKKAGEA
jgi:hypothetical protein